MIKKTRLMVDGHVHIYDSYDLDKFFKIANAYLDHYYNKLYANGSPYEKVLLLTEGKTNDFFWQLKKEGGFANDSGFQCRETKEQESIVLTKDGKPVCYILRGRQIVTEENLEVLALATNQTIEDGLPMDTVIEMLTKANDLAVLAWGFGKWLFKRGKVIQRVLDTCRSPYLLAADNSGRPVFWPTPNAFKKAKALNIPRINGSDPLPFKEEIAKVGSYGFTVEGEFDPEEPGRSMREILTIPGVGDEIELFGKRDGVFPFFTRQAKIYLKKYLKK